MTSGATTWATHDILTHSWALRFKVDTKKMPKAKLPKKDSTMMLAAKRPKRCFALLALVVSSSKCRRALVLWHVPYACSERKSGAGAASG